MNQLIGYWLSEQEPSDEQLDRHFNAVLKTCALAPLPTRLPEPEPVRILTPAPTWPGGVESGEIVAYIGLQLVSRSCGPELNGAWELLRCAYNESKYVYENRAGYLRERPNLEQTYAPLSCYIARFSQFNDCFLGDDIKAVPSGMRSTHASYLKAERRLVGALYDFENMLQQAYREIDRDLRERMFNVDMRLRLKDIERAWYGYTLEHSKLIKLYTRP